jgi:EmrB/QacA subfamily drug resistance transporter
MVHQSTRDADKNLGHASLPGPGQDASRRELRMVLTGLMLALTLAALDQNIVATALPRITGELGGLQHLSWVVTAFVVASTVSAPLYGSLSDLYGRKPAFTVSILLFLAGSVLCALAGDLIQLIAFRAVQGLGAGGLIVLAQTVIGDLVSPRERGRYQGLFAAVFAACSVAGPLIGGLITEYASWRWIFYVNLPVGAAALALIIVFLRPHPSGAARRLDLAGAALLVVGTCCLLLLLSWGGSAYPWISAPVMGLGVAAAASFVLLVAVERRAAQPIMSPDLFRNRVFVIGAAVIALAAMALFAGVVFLPLMFQLLMGASPASAGLMISPMMGGVIVASFVGGRLVSRTGRYKLFPVLGLLAATLSYGTLAWAAHAGMGVLPIEGILVLMGLGIGLVMPNLTTAIQNAVERTELGGATAAAAFFRSLGGALGVALSGAVLASHLKGLPAGMQAAEGVAEIASLPEAQRATILAAYRAGLSGAFAVGAAIAAVGLTAVLFLPELPLRDGRGRRDAAADHEDG